MTASGSGTVSVVARPVEAGDAPLLSALFDASGSSCFCQYWSFDGDHRAWQMRLALEPEANRSALEEELASGQPLGVVASASGAIVGWLRLGTPAFLARTYQGRLYRGLPCLGADRPAVLGVGCLLVHPEWRRRGVARELLRAAVNLARARGFQTLDGFPRGAHGVPDEEYWTGAPGLFESEGFELRHAFEPYPVLSRPLAASVPDGSAP